MKGASSSPVDTPPDSSRGIPFALGVALAAALGGTSCSPASTVPQDPDSQKPTVDLRVALQLESAAVPADLGQKAYQHCNTVVSFGPRYVGSRGWREAITYIHRELGALELNAIHDRWADEEEKLAFENIHTTIAGQVPDRIVIGCHHDTKCTQGHPDPEHNYEFVGANDSGSGVGLMLALADVLRQRDNYATIQLVFFDGEESVPYKWSNSRSLFGSRRFVEQYLARQESGQDTSTIRAFILLDMVGRRDLNIDEVLNSDRRLRDIAFAAARACDVEDKFYRHAWEVTDDHVPFYREGIPTLNLIDLKYNEEWHTADDTMEHIAAESLQTIGQVVLTALPEIEERYVRGSTPGAPPAKSPIKFR